MTAQDGAWTFAERLFAEDDDGRPEYYDIILLGT